MPCEFYQTHIPDVILIKPRVFSDERGFFIESYKKSEFEQRGINPVFVQDNHSFSKKHVIRGLHYQRDPMAQGKLIRVIYGSVWDVAVDIRPNSPTFKKWVGVELSDINHEIVYIPPGFAHGFIALTDTVHIFYKCTVEYSPQYDTGIRWDDPDIGIQWPTRTPIISEKDKNLPLLKDIYSKLLQEKGIS